MHIELGRDEIPAGCSRIKSGREVGGEDTSAAYVFEWKK